MPVKHGLSCAVALALHAMAGPAGAEERPGHLVFANFVDTSPASVAADEDRDLLASEGGALFMQWTPSGARLVAQPEWWMLLDPDTEQLPTPTRIPPAPRSNPWRVPLKGDTSVHRRGSGRVDHPHRLEAGVAVEFALSGSDTDFIVEVSRDTSRVSGRARSRTSLTVLADGVEVFAGLPALPNPSRRPYSIDSEERLLERVAEQRIVVPAGTRMLRIEGEPGAYLRVLAPLGGSSAEIRDAADAATVFAPLAGETSDDTYRRALANVLPGVSATTAAAHALRHGFFAPVALSSSDTKTVIQSRHALVRTVAPKEETAEWQGDDTEIASRYRTPIALYWLGADSALTLPAEPKIEREDEDGGTHDNAEAAAPRLYRFTVAHPMDMDAEDRRIDLSLHDDRGERTALAFDPMLASHLSKHATAEDGSLAKQQDSSSMPLIDASQLRVLLPTGRRIVSIANRDRNRGLWLALERQWPAPAPLAAMPGTPGLHALADTLRRALLDRTQPPIDDRGAVAAATLISARRDAFEADACTMIDAPPSPADAAAALALAERLGGDDPVLVRCARFQSVATLSPPSPAAVAGFRRWAIGQDRLDLTTGLHASIAARSQTPESWHALADALRAEGESVAASWMDAIAAIAGSSARPAEPAELAVTEPPAAGQRDDDAIDAHRVIPHDSAGSRWMHVASRLRPSLLWAATPQQPLRWAATDAGTHTLTLRASGGQGAAWVRLESGTHSHLIALPTAHAQGDERTAGPTAHIGPATTLLLRSDSPGASLRLIPLEGEVLAELDRSGDPAHDATLATHAGIADERQVELRQVVAGERRRRTLTLKISRLSLPISAPSAQPDEGVFAIAGAGAPVLTLDGGIAPENARYPQDPAQAVIEALWLRNSGSEDAVSAAGWALRASESAALAPDTQRLRGQLRAAYRWRPFEQIVASGGQWLRPLADGQSRSPEFVARSAHGGELPRDAIVLAPGREWRIDGFPSNRRMRLRMILHAALPGARLRVGVDKQSFVFRGGERRNLALRADGDGAIVLTLGEALPASYLRVEVPEGAGVRSADSEPYHLPLPEAPLRIYSERPALLLVTEWDGQRDATRLQWVNAGESALHAERLPGAALRVDRLVDVAPRASYPKPAASPSTAPAAADAAGGATKEEPRPLAMPGPGVLLESRLQRTPGAYGGLFQRRDPDDTTASVERYAEFGARWRIGSEDGRWRSRIDTFARRHSRGFDVLGADALLEWQPPESAWQAAFSAQTLYQPDVRIDGRRPASIRLGAEVGYERVYDDRWESRFELGAIAHRATPDDTARADATRLDSELQNEYRIDHPLLPYAGYRLRWRADWRDTLSADLRVIGNTPGDGGLDGTRLSFDWHRVGPRWVHNASLDWRRAFADGDRRRGYDRLRIGGSSTAYRLGPIHGWRLRLEGAYDLRDRAAIAAVRLEWFRHDGRGIGDLLGSEVPLRGVLEHDLYPALRKGSAP
jgi:hypothetical protein